MADQRRAPALSASALDHHRKAQRCHLRLQRVAEDGRRDAAGASGAIRVGTGEGGRALPTGNYTPEVRRRLLAAWVVWGARLRRGPGAPLTRRGVGPTLTYRGEARTTAQFINSTHLLVPSPVQRRSGRLPPRPPGPLRVLELCFGTASAMAAPLWGLHRRGVSPAGLLIPFAHPSAG